MGVAVHKRVGSGTGSLGFIIIPRMPSIQLDTWSHGSRIFIPGGGESAVALSRAITVQGKVPTTIILRLGFQIKPY